MPPAYDPVGVTSVLPRANLIRGHHQLLHLEPDRSLDANLDLSSVDVIDAVHEVKDELFDAGEVFAEERVQGAVHGQLHVADAAGREARKRRLKKEKEKLNCILNFPAIFKDISTVVVR